MFIERNLFDKIMRTPKMTTSSKMEIINTEYTGKFEIKKIYAMGRFKTSNKKVEICNSLTRPYA